MAVKIKKGQVLSLLTIMPLIDVVFLLLIFFLIATRFEEEERHLDVVLPSASEAMPLTVEPKEVFVNIDRHGMFFVNGHKMDAREVQEVLQAAVDNNPLHQSVIIRADKRVSFQPVVTVMNLCNKVGVADYSVTTADDDG